MDTAYGTPTNRRGHNKHFDRVFHLIHEQVQHLKLKLVHVKTDEQRADFYTKALSDFKFEQSANIISE